MFSEGSVLSQYESALCICNASKADKAQVFLCRLPVNTDISRCYPQKLWIIYVHLFHAPVNDIRPGAARMQDNARAPQLAASVNSNMPPRYIIEGFLQHPERDETLFLTYSPAIARAVCHQRPVLHAIAGSVIPLLHIRCV